MDEKVETRVGIVGRAPAPAAVRRYVDRGADLSWIPDYAEGAPLHVDGSLSTCHVVSRLREQGAMSAKLRD